MVVTGKRRIPGYVGAMKREFLRYRLLTLAQMLASNELSDESRKSLMRIQAEVEEQLTVYERADAPRIPR